MNVIVAPSTISGELIIPPSKSIAQRVLAASLLHKGVTTIYNFGSSDDEKAALTIIQQLGVRTIIKSNELRIISEGVVPTTNEIKCGESGLSARLFTPIAATSSLLLTIQAEGSLSKRPMHFFKEILSQLHVEVDDSNGTLPISVQGPLIPKDILIDGSLSSQFLTGLLFAFVCSTSKKVVITVNALASRPYIDLTLEVLKNFGHIIYNEGYERFVINPIPIINSEINYTIEADWSSASYWIVAALIAGDISLKGLNENSLQADKAILEVVKKCGGNFEFDGVFLKVNQTEKLRSFEFDASDAPDLFPILSMLASCCEGISRITGLHRLKHKESDREKSIIAMLTSFGVNHKKEKNTLIIKGTRSIKSCIINAFSDHRIAMSAAIGALKADGDVLIKDAECVSKSYPDFFKHLHSFRRL